MRASAPTAGAGSRASARPLGTRHNIAALPVLDAIDPYVAVRGIEWHIIDQPKAMHHSGSAVVSFILDHAPSIFRCLSLLEQKGMITFFDPQDRAQIVMVKRLDVRRI